MSFVFEEVSESDSKLYNSFDFRGKWSSNVFIKWTNMSKWVIDRENGMALVPLGGGAFEMPEFFELVYFDNPQNKVEIWAYKSLKEHRATPSDFHAEWYDVFWDIEKIMIPNELTKKSGKLVNSIMDEIKDAFDIYIRNYAKGYGNPRSIILKNVAKPEIIRRQ